MCVAMKATFFVLVPLVLAPRPGTGEPAAQDESDLKALEQVYQSDIRPLLQRYCHKCHAGKRTEAVMRPTTGPGSSRDHFGRLSVRGSTALEVRVLLK